MENLANKFFSLLRLGLNCENDEDHSLAVNAGEWPLLYKMAQRHGVMGVAFAGVQRLSERKSATGAQDDGSLPAKALLLQWFGIAEKIRKSNMLMDRQCAELTRMLESAGLDSCILKGQGLSRMYPERGIRQTGDIDVWVKTRVVDFGDSLNASFAEVRKRLSSIKEGKIGKTVYHHIEWRLPTAEVEVHIRPQQLNNPFFNRAFQHWCNEQWLKMSIRNAVRNVSPIGTNANAPSTDSNTPATTFNTPNIKFNAVYLLAHMYHHLLFEGLAMKQICDYAVLLRSEEAGGIEKKELEETIRSFGMLRFARGIMWLMHEVFNLPQEKILVEPDEDEGRFVLNEIMEGRGNTTNPESMAVKFWQRTIYRTRFLTHYPTEILWDIPFRLYHFAWRLRYA